MRYLCAMTTIHCLFVNYDNGLGDGKDTAYGSHHEGSARDSPALVVETHELMSSACRVSSHTMHKWKVVVLQKAQFVGSLCAGIH